VRWGVNSAATAREAIASGETAVIDVMVTTDAANMLPGIDARALAAAGRG
jgi:hypothetical protein